MLTRLVAALATLGFVLTLAAPAHAGYCVEGEIPDGQHTTVTACTP